MPRREITETDATQPIDYSEDAPTGDALTGEASTEEKPRRRSRKLKVLLISLIVVVALGAGGLLAVGLYVHSVESRIEKVEAFDDVPAVSRPEKVAKNALNFLILGSDTRDPESTGGSRSDTIIVAHITQDHSSAQLISIPRDTWVHIPKSKDGRHGDTKAKINAAFSWGGIPLVVQTVEEYTGVRIDHVAIVDFSGFKDIVDALGGVEIDVQEGFTSTHSLNADHKRVFQQGRQTMDGAAALDYARERYAFKDGDFARIRHQQQVIKAILDKAASGDVLTNPGKLNDFLKSTANAVAVDNTLNLFSTASDLRHLRSGNLTFMTNPTKGTGMVGSESVVFDDPGKAKVLYEAVRKDNVPAILAVK